MGSWYRSEKMQYASLVMSEQAAPAVLRELGTLGAVEFTDMNPHITPFQRRYVSVLKRYMKLENQIRYIHGQIKTFDEIVVKPGGEDEDEDEGMELGAHVSLLEDMEGTLSKLEESLKGLGEYGDKLSANLADAVGLDSVLVALRETFTPHVSSLEMIPTTVGPIETERTSLLADERGGRNEHDFAFTRLYGVMPTSEKSSFERMIYRSTRGNCLVRFSESSDPEADRIVFMLMYKSARIDKKVKRICEASGARTYSMGEMEDVSTARALEASNKATVADLRGLIVRNKMARRRLCEDAALNVEEWLYIVKRERSIYVTMNMMKADIGGMLLRGRVWVLENRVEEAREAINRAHQRLQLTTSTIFEPVHKAWPMSPTYFETNKYTEAFQEFVNTYGVPRYGEINPALFTAASFPFLFGIMYGDVGHGTCLMIAGILMILTEKTADARGTGEMLKGLYMGRYMFFLMGVFAVYAGLMYNDFFSLGLNLFGSKYTFETHEPGAKATPNGPYGSSADVYPFGSDPAWKISTNELLFFNSMKMKMSVILGITQMIFGVFIRGANCVYFSNWLDFVCDFIPMLIFAGSFFGFMIVLIMTKWSINWEERMAMGTCSYDEAGTLGACSTDDSDSCFTVDGRVCTGSDQLVDICPLDYGGTGDGCQPPNIITTLINIPLKPGTCAEPMFEGQSEIQSTILMWAGIAVPWLLLAKPFYQYYTHNAKVKEAAVSKGEYVEIPDASRSSGMSDSTPLLGANEVSDSDTDGHGAGDADGHGHGEEFNFMEEFIHQAIETIEFVLGMVSNTASYLRLWALSLAHTQLANVFWEKCMVSTIKMGNPFAIFLGYTLFASVTTGVLLCMDVLECFLHALRLHWVEFQSKFYKADGVKFQPYSTKALRDSCVLE